jgi:hypothetical protein
MNMLIAALIVASFAVGAASAQVAAASDLPVATPVHKKAAPAAKHRRAASSKGRARKTGSF